MIIFVTTHVSLLMLIVEGKSSDNYKRGCFHESRRYNNYLTIIVTYILEIIDIVWSLFVYLLFLPLLLKLTFKSHDFLSRFHGTTLLQSYLPHEFLLSLSSYACFFLLFAYLPTLCLKYKTSGQNIFLHP